MNFGGKTRGGRMLIVEITPMIDVVFLLIIFFMTTAQFARMTRADVELPRERGEQEERPDEAGLIINITAQGEIIVDETTVDLDALEQRVREAVEAAAGDASQVKLMVRADRRAESGVLNEVLNRLESVGVGLARLATEVPR